MMKRLKTMLAVITSGETFFARHDDGKVIPEDLGGVAEAHLRHTANLRASHLSERGRHERTRRRTRNPGAAAGQVHLGTPPSHRHRLH